MVPLSEVSKQVSMFELSVPWIEEAQISKKGSKSWRSNVRGRDEELPDTQRGGL